MQSILQEIITAQLFTFLLLFMRFGMAVMIMPGIGDSFVTPQVRLLFSLAFCLVLTPPLSVMIPAAPATAPLLVALLVSEMLIGIYIGTVMRIMISALDTAGSIISIQTGFSSALLFNPVSDTQGSVVGAIYSMLGVTLLMVMDLHHFMLAAIVDSYHLFPAKGGLPDLAGMSDLIAGMVALAFKTGTQIALPFLVVGMIMQMGFGVLSRLMPQIQIFFLALPAQITVGLLIMTITLSAGVLFWVSIYEQTVTQAISP